MGRNLDNVSGNFLCIQGLYKYFLDKQVDRLLNHESKYISPSQTKKIYGNIKRIGKSFSGRIKPLYLTMVIQSELGKGERLVRDATTASFLESEQDSDNLGEDASKQERRIDDIDQDEDITLVNDQDDAEMFDVNDLAGEEVFVAEQEVVKEKTKKVVEEVVDVAQVNTAATVVTITTKEITLAQALEALKISKLKEKGKGIMVEEPVKPKKTNQIKLDEETTKRIYIEFDEEERISRERERELKKKWKPILHELKHRMMFKQRLMLIINWLKDCKHKNKKS
nr:hypothetical protein [Tanacetum cinerariifolium]